jgi:hypothetical protein
MKKFIYLFCSVPLLLFYSCKDTDASNLPIAWEKKTISFQTIKLRAGASTVCYPNNGPYSGSRYVSYAHPIDNFINLFAYPASTLNQNELIDSKITATTKANYNGRQPNDVLSQTEEYDGNTNYNRSTQSISGLTHNSIKVWYAKRRALSSQHLSLTIISGPYRRTSDDALGDLIWTWLDITKDNFPDATVSQEIIEVGTFYLEGTFQRIQSQPFAHNIFINGSLHQYNVSMIEQTAGMALRIMAL